jgi:hypothetical protein
MFARLWAALRAAVIAYPGGLAAVLGIVVALAARYGFHLTVTELMGVYALAAAVIGAYVHVAVKAKVKGAYKAALRPQIKRHQ